MQDAKVETIARAAEVFSHATRIKIISLLMDESGRGGMTTMDISTRLGVAQPRISSHLAILLQARVVSVSRRGRARIYELASGNVSSIIKDLAAISLRKSLSAKPHADERSVSERIRQCRSCYDHLAGIAGVELLERMMRAGWLKKVSEHSGRNGKVLFEPTPLGLWALQKRGVDVDHAKKSKNRLLAYGCLDWTEKRPHLGGALGSAVLDSVLSQGFVQRRSGTRALKLVKPISCWISGQK